MHYSVPLIPLFYPSYPPLIFLLSLRWTVIFQPNEKEQDETKMAIANDTNSANTTEDSTSIFVMNNYFYMACEGKPDKFNSRLELTQFSMIRQPMIKT